MSVHVVTALEFVQETPLRDEKVLMEYPSILTRKHIVLKSHTVSCKHSRKPNPKTGREKNNSKQSVRTHTKNLLWIFKSRQGESNTSTYSYVAKIGHHKAV